MREVVVGSGIGNRDDRATMSSDEGTVKMKRRLGARRESSMGRRSGLLRSRVELYHHLNESPLDIGGRAAEPHLRNRFKGGETFLPPLPRPLPLPLQLSKRISLPCTHTLSIGYEVW